jgi:hypothetical protein
MVWPILIGSAVGKLSIFSDQIMASTLVVGSVPNLSLFATSTKKPRVTLRLSGALPGPATGGNLSAQ